MEGKIAKIREDAVAAIEAAGVTLADLDGIRVKVFGKKGELTAIQRGMGKLDPAERPRLGQIVNEARAAIESALEKKRAALAEEALAAKLAGEKIDVTLPGRREPLGHLHPLTVTMERIKSIFMAMGYSVEEGPEIERDHYNFEALNLPKDHPARDMQDTFFIERSNTMDVTKNVLLRSHTSNDEAHYMSTHKPPIRVLCPGRVYRNEAISARAHCFFHQVEGLYVDRNVSFTDLKQVLLTFAREMFGAGTKIRLRPSYFPFTEPSAEMDISCNICGGEGCGFCKHTGWVEILGCGMVDPHDLEACGIDSSVYTGYAFGMGVERIANLKYRVSDLRLFSENDTRFLREFEGA